MPPSQLAHDVRHARDNNGIGVEPGAVLLNVNLDQEARVEWQPTEQLPTITLAVPGGGGATAPGTPGGVAGGGGGGGAAAAGPPAHTTTTITAGGGGGAGGGAGTGVSAFMPHAGGAAAAAAAAAGGVGARPGFGGGAVGLTADVLNEMAGGGGGADVTHLPPIDPYWRPVILFGLKEVAGYACQLHAGNVPSRAVAMVGAHTRVSWSRRGTERRRALLPARRSLADLARRNVA